MEGGREGGRARDRWRDGGGDGGGEGGGEGGQERGMDVEGAGGGMNGKVLRKQKGGDGGQRKRGRGREGCYSATPSRGAAWSLLFSRRISACGAAVLCTELVIQRCIARSP